MRGGPRPPGTCRGSAFLERETESYLRRRRVDVDAGEDFARSIGEAVRSTHPAQKGRVLDALQDFAGLFRLGEGYRDPVLVSGTDGVGTKLQVAQAPRPARHDRESISWRCA